MKMDILMNSKKTKKLCLNSKSNHSKKTSYGQAELDFIATEHRVTMRSRLGKSMLCNTKDAALSVVLPSISVIVIFHIDLSMLILRVEIY